MARPRSLSGKDAETWKTLRDQQRGSYSLDSACGNELSQRCRRTSHGGDRKQGHAPYTRAGGRSGPRWRPQQKQRCSEQRVGLDHPWMAEEFAWKVDWRVAERR